MVCCWLSGIAQQRSANVGLDIAAARQLVARILPQRANAFVVEPLSREAGSGDAGKDVYEVEASGGRVFLRGNNGVAVASALYYYLTEVCHCQVTWNGVNLQLPAQLPGVSKKVRRLSPYRYRYYLNYCTFNYSMSWWGWERWQQEIDWMALHGINMPLAITGEEYTWDQVYRKMGFSDEEMKEFFSGPAYFAWFWMGNLDGWGGPLSKHWLTMQRDLQKKILGRERELGMTPVLPAFTGHVPPSFLSRFPRAKCKVTNWKNGFKDTYILDASDSLFAVIGKKFLLEQTALFGTDHFYSADTFNENEPPSDDPAFLSGLSAKIYDGMRDFDPAAVWVMQGWLFYSDRKFWKSPQIEALLNAVPGDRMLLLDLAAEIEPVWKRTQAFYGKPWIWNMLNNFGGNVNLFGRMDGVATGPALALNDTASGRLQGIGLTMEAIEQNPVIYELMMQNTWQQAPVDPEVWLRSYIRNRYGYSSPGLEKAWDILRHTVYNGQRIRDGAESIVTGRPTFDSTTIWTRTALNYRPADLLPAWDLLVKAAGDGDGMTTERGNGRSVAGARAGKTTDGFRFDLVDITRQVLANYALVVQQGWVKAFRTGDTTAFNKGCKDFLGLIRDMDRLLATRKDFLLGPWLADARRKGITPAEQDLYESNARDLITLWGDANSPLHEYSNRQWSGLLSDFYSVRWQQFFDLLRVSRAKGEDPDLAAFEKEISAWEWRWVHQHKKYPVAPSGDAVTEVKKLYKKYRHDMELAYQR
jgi:alpha-N-acetylglucosaminidase